MRWELRFKRDGHSILSGDKKGRKEPDWFDRPAEEDGDEFYMNGFWELNTCRPLGFGSPGQIPWSTIHEYGVVKGLEPDVLDCFIQVIMAMDHIYLEHMTEELSLRQKKNATPPQNRH